MSTTNTEQWGNIELPGLSDEELFKKNWNYSRKGNKTYQEAMKKLHSCPTYRNNINKIIQSRSIEEKNKISKNITNGKLKLNQQQVDYIWELGWSSERGTALYKMLCIKFNIKPHTIFNILNGTHPLKKIDSNIIEQMKKDWISIFGDQRGKNISKGKILSNRKDI